ncbi:MAG: bacteriohemerythrin [Blautia sp.]|nr:bacteriohemerythrin [Clostridia bacterium]MDY4692522.1 bacteriohemerythrin [Blautia sp.]MDY5555134.1 bacteriohemerythrin [Blautia sp.]
MGITFDESLHTGNELIDSQHQELINRVNKLADSISTTKEKNVAIQTLDFLMDYTDFHFSAEEKLQEEAGYPQLTAHKKQHADFVKAVNDLKEMLEEEEGPSDAFVEAVNRNITEWLVNHIQGWDKKVAEFIRG